MTDIAAMPIYDPWVARSETVFNLAANLDNVKDAEGREYVKDAIEILLKSMIQYLPTANASQSQGKVVQLPIKVVDNDKEPVA